MTQEAVSQLDASKASLAGLDTFDHVVVLMLENRSFDNLLGFVYPNGVPSCAPAGKTFDGVNTSMANPVPKGAVNQPPDRSGLVHVAMTGDYHQPYPDPGEEYYHVNVQLYNAPDGGECPPYNLPNPAPSPPGMNGFVTDYIEKLSEKVSKPDGPPTFEQYSQIMQCFDPCKVPVLSKLAQEFGVFDHWYCSVPSQTWCNRAFWHAGTSWGRVNQVPYTPWFENNYTTTFFNQISDSGSGLTWNVYHDTPFVSLTNIIHSGALIGHESHFHSMGTFFRDCAAGNLPSYSFLEPDFIFQHNDYHPSSAGWGVVDHETYAGSVLLGEHLVAKVYDAIKSSAGRKDKTGNTSQNTLLIITFDEHGGTFDHAPPLKDINSPDLTGLEHQEDFDFARSGIRVPTIMVSANIACNTVINTPLMHTAFLKTMQAKWGGNGKFPQISPRQASDGMFTEVFTAVGTPRPAESWPSVQPPPLLSELGAIPWDEPISDLGQSIISGMEALLKKKQIEHSAAGVVTKAQAMAYLEAATKQLQA
jgi:phospholipase C